MKPISEKITTAQVTELFDPLTHTPPEGTMLLVVNPGGVLHKSTWYDGAIAWGYLPQIPMSVKLRHSPKGTHEHHKTNV